MDIDLAWVPDRQGEIGEDVSPIVFLERRGTTGGTKVPGNLGIELYYILIMSKQCDETWDA